MAYDSDGAFVPNSDGLWTLTQVAGVSPGKYQVASADIITMLGTSVNCTATYNGQDVDFGILRFNIL